MVLPQPLPAGCLEPLGARHVPGRPHQTVVCQSFQQRAGEARDEGMGETCTGFGNFRLGWEGPYTGSHPACTLRLRGMVSGHFPGALHSFLWRQMAQVMSEQEFSK